MSYAEVIAQLLPSWIPHWFMVLFVAMIPIVELRGAIPFGLEILDMGWKSAMFWSIIGNMIPIPILLWFFPAVEKGLRRFRVFQRFFDWIFERTRRKAGSKVEKYKEFALVLFVAIPLPVTGAWTGSLVAYLFDLEKKRALFFIFVGVLIAGCAVLAIFIINLWVGLLIIGALVVAYLLISRI